MRCTICCAVSGGVPRDIGANLIPGVEIVIIHCVWCNFHRLVLLLEAAHCSSVTIYSHDGLAIDGYVYTYGSLSVFSSDI